VITTIGVLDYTNWHLFWRGSQLILLLIRCAISSTAFAANPFSQLDAIACKTFQIAPQVLIQHTNNDKATAWHALIKI
jgi:hypothetical protein